MKTILVPTDLSPTANNAIEYAAKLAQQLNAEIEIINIQSLSPIQPLISGIMAKEKVLETSKQLAEVCDDVSRTFNVPCNHSIETTIAPLEKIIGNKSGESNLIVMGTNGVDDVYQYIFGTNTHQVIRKSKCPVLVIPDGVSYGTVKKIVFAWDYKQDSIKSFLQLQDLLGMKEADLIFLHISKHHTSISDDVFRAYREEILSYPGKKDKITFDRIYSEDPDTFANRIDEYMKDSKADLLATTYYDRGALKNIFHGTITKELSELITYPLLVMHEE